jgi:hypothetical protein
MAPTSNTLEINVIEAQNLLRELILICTTMLNEKNKYRNADIAISRSSEMN